MRDLTQKQKRFFENLKEQYGQNPLPAYETIAKDFNFKHKNSVFQYFKKLKEENLIQEKNNHFIINPKLFGAKMFSSNIRAGFASAIEDGFEKRISLDTEFEINAPSTFVFKVSGDSMVDLGIFEGDIIIIKKCTDAKDGDIVLANLDGGLTLKTYKHQAGRSFLRAANKKYPDMYPKNSLSVFGTALGIVRKF